MSDRLQVPVIEEGGGWCKRTHAALNEAEEVLTQDCLSDQATLERTGRKDQ
jgi:hypothetical protein